MINDDEMMPESANTQSQVGPEDFSQGYEICIEVTSTGYKVEGPMPLKPEPQTEDPNQEQESEEVPDTASALKHVLAIIKQHPIGDDAEGQMQAGFDEGTRQ